MRGYQWNAILFSWNLTYDWICICWTLKQEGSFSVIISDKLSLRPRYTISLNMTFMALKRSVPPLPLISATFLFFSLYPSAQSFLVFYDKKQFPSCFTDHSFSFKKSLEHTLTFQIFVHMWPLELDNWPQLQNLSLIVLNLLACFLFWLSAYITCSLLQT